MVQYKLTEFQSPTGKWHLICNDLVGKAPHGGWYLPANILGISVVDFITKLVNEYHAELTIYHNQDGSFEWLGYSWHSMADMARFKNAVNLQARNKRFMI